MAPPLPCAVWLDKRSPSIRLGDRLQYLVAVFEIPTEVTLEKKRFRQPTKNTKRGLKPHQVDHHGPAIVGFELVIVGESSECSLHHGVLKEERALEHGDP